MDEHKIDQLLLEQNSPIIVESQNIVIEGITHHESKVRKKIKGKRPFFSQKTTFIINIVFTLIIFFVEIIIGHLYNAISLVSDSFHMLSDVASMFVGFLALLKASSDRTLQNEKNSQYTYGFERFQIMGALANGVLLMAFSFNILIESGLKLISPTPITEPKYVLFAGIVGLVANLISLVFFHSHLHGHGHEHEHDRNLNSTRGYGETSQTEGHSQQHSIGHSHHHGSCNSLKKNKKKPKSSSYLNIYGVFLHIVGDFIGSVLVIIVSTLKMYITDDRIDYLDPVLSIVLAVIMGFASFTQLRNSVPIFLQKTPPNLDTYSIKREILQKFPEILSVHELHIWQLASSTFIATLHIKIENSVDIKKVVSDIKILFKSHDVFSVTIQPEIVDFYMIENNSDKDDFCNNGVQAEDERDLTCCPHLHKID